MSLLKYTTDHIRKELLIQSSQSTYPT